MPILCEIVTQERLVYSGQVDMVVLDGAEGRMGILPNHSPLLTTLQVSEMRVQKDQQEETFAVGGGVLEVRPDCVTVLADVAEHADEIDLARAKMARERAVAFLEAGGPPAPVTPEVPHDITLALKRANVRLRVGEKRREKPGLSGLDDSE
ncbi:MAG: ATP synthase F1 subunit epsilon [Anaerolineales bacterium]|jgi:F-type H+-transporting ATPase subunit epsilon|nr:ATP synthase F1 subunit epsilon [Anaerolineales bacterium]